MAVAQVKPATSPKAKIAKRIRAQSNMGHFVTVKELTEPPFTFTEETAIAHLQAMAADEAYEDIVWLEGLKGRYLYSKVNMTENYAKHQVHIVENNSAGMLAQAVRHDSQVYPRPTPMNAFFRSPYSLQKDSLEAVLNQIKVMEDYRDIQEITASNGARYLFSEKYLEAGYARSLVELKEVIEDE